MFTITLEEARSQLSAWIDRLEPGDTLLITRDQKPIAHLLVEGLPLRKPRKAGSAKGILTIIQEDDEHLKDFEEYLT